MTGESYEDLTYPEFKGYHANLYWAEVNTTESPFYVFSATEDVFFRMLTPETNTIRKGLKYNFPEGEISFLSKIYLIVSFIEEGNRQSVFPTQASIQWLVRSYFPVGSAKSG